MFPLTYTKFLEIYSATDPLMRRIMEQSVSMGDYLHSLRFMMSSAPGDTEVFVKAITDLMEYVNALERVAQSYHSVVGSVVHFEVTTANVPDFDSEALLRKICFDQEKSDVD